MSEVTAITETVNRANDPRIHQTGVDLMADPSEQQRRYREFLDLLPLTLSLAGLPASEHGRYYTDEQIESRLFTIRNAYKHAQQIARETISK